MSEEKKEVNPIVEVFDKVVLATSDYLRAIFPHLFKMFEMKKKKD